MYRLATMNDMIELVAWKKRASRNVPTPWGLKRYGILLCERYIEDVQPSSVLEAGVGFDAHFHDVIDPPTDYWTIDKQGFYDSELFQRGLESRHRATHVDGLLGEFLPQLPSRHFSLSFSISALEHSDSSDAPTICADLYRITKPGGLTVHTIDTPAHNSKLRLEPWHDAFLAAGFEYLEEPDLACGTTGTQGLAVLVEPLDVQVTYYKGRADFWEKPHLIRDHQATIAVAARRAPISQP